MDDQEYIAALEAENKALKRETDYIKQIKEIVPRMVEARADREKCSAIRKLIYLDKENRALKRAARSAA